MKFHIHIGAHKTATTFIQSSLADDRQALAEAGIAMPGIWKVRKQFSNAFDRLSWLDPVGSFLTRPHLKRKLDGLIQDGGDRETFILSDENLAGLISANYWTGGLYRRAGARVKILNGLLAPAEPHYFICIRRYPEYLTSSWLQLAARGRAPSFESYLRRLAPARVSWADMVASVAKAAGSSRVTVWTYDRFRREPDQIFDLLAPGMKRKSDEQDANRDVLPSLTVKGLKVLTLLEPHLSRSELERLGRLMRNFTFDEPNPRLEIIDPTMMTAYEARYTHDIARIRALGVTLLD
jgi:hypothetical protein